MAGTILENLSARKLTILVSSLMLCQLACFLIGGLIAPVPSSVENILGTVCRDRPGAHNDTSIWMYSRGSGRCESVELGDDAAGPTEGGGVGGGDGAADMRMANKIVFVFQMPLPRDGRVRDYSRWQQNFIGVLQPNLAYHSSYVVQPHTELTIDARLAYRNRGDADDDWKLYTSALEQRHLDCTVDNHIDEYLYNCDTIPLFELGSLHHDYYLLNIRLPVDTQRKMNLNIGNVKDLNLAVIYQNGGFTKVWVALKTAFFPFIVCIMWWFWRRVHQLQRSPVLIEYMLLYLGGALTVLNMPLEYFTLAFDMPYMLLLSDIRQGLFYAMLLSFWLVFAGEHMLIQDAADVRPSVRHYWRHLSAVGCGCVSLFVFDVAERGGQLRNPFYSIWISHWGAQVAMTFIVLAGVSAGCYFLFLCFMVWRVFRNIGAKQTALPTMSAARRLHYEGIIYRFKFLMLATLVCAGMTVVGFVMGQMAEGQWRWNDNVEIEFTSAFFTGVYGMWNIYIFALIVLYAPSHKQWATEQSSNENIVSEEIEFNNLPSDQNASEISSLTSFAARRPTINKLLAFAL